MTFILPVLLVGQFACNNETPKTATPSPSPVPTTTDTPPDVDARLSLQTQSVTAGARFDADAPLIAEFTVPDVMVGGGFPSDLYAASDEDRSLIQLELPLAAYDKSDEFGGPYVGSWDEPVFCTVGASCSSSEDDGFWAAEWWRDSERIGELQLSRVTQGTFVDMEGVGGPLFTGVWVPEGELLQPGDVVRLMYVGHAPKRATDWTGNPLHLHVRYRADPECPAADSQCWSVLDDSQVDPLTIKAGPAEFVHVYAPLDVVAGEPFSVAVVTRDAWGNPAPWTGTISLDGDVALAVDFSTSWREETIHTWSTPGDYRILPSGSALRGIHHWTVAHDEAAPAHRQVGDVHFHTGDGGAQRKFMQSFSPGDHDGLYTRSFEALRYMDEVAGFDFGAPSEHAVRGDDYVFPPAVVADPEFQSGGTCAGAGKIPEGVANWWPLSQSIGRTFPGDFIVFPAFEWHARHSATDHSRLHRVVMYRDFSASDDLPMLPGDVAELPPQCIVRFVQTAGLTPNEVLILPHMMLDDSQNIDWDLTYSGPGVDILATRADIEAFQPVGEIFSARNLYQPAPLGVPSLLLFEGDPVTPERYTFRHAWRTAQAHIGVIGSSDNHSQMPGVNDDAHDDGSEYHLHEPGGMAIVLANDASRDGIYDALRDRHTYATSGVRAWMDFSVDGALMGSEITASAAQIQAKSKVLSGLDIYRMELWAAKVGDDTTPYQTLVSDEPYSQSHSLDLAIDNPVLPGAEDEQWLYYVRALVVPLDAVGAHSEAIWSSPIWVNWSAAP